MAATDTRTVDVLYNLTALADLDGRLPRAAGKLAALHNRA